MKELAITDFDPSRPYVPQRMNKSCAILFMLSTCHWCHDEKDVLDELDREIGFMNLYTFTVDKSPENFAHWTKITKTVKSAEPLGEGFPVTMLYSSTGRVVALQGFQAKQHMKAKLMEFAENKKR